MAFSKDQQKYLIARIDGLAAEAQRKARPIIRNEKNAELVIAVEKAGFIVKDRYYLSNAVGLAGRDDPDKLEEDKLIDIRKRAQAAKDSIMLGDSEDALAVLAQLEKDFA